MSLYTKNKKGEFVPIEINSVLSRDLNNRLVIVKIGTDEHPASFDDIEATAESFAKADVLDELDNVSVILTPYQINIDLVDEEEIKNKHICLQIVDGEDIGMLESATKSLYNKLKKRHTNVTVVPSPLTVKDYRQVQDTLERCKIRKRRRFNSN